MDLIRKLIKIDHKDKVKWMLLWCAFIILSFSHVFYAIWGEKYIHKDGAGFFYAVLFNRDFALYPAGRVTSNYIQQLFAVLGCRLGITSIPTMGLLYGLGYTLWIFFFWGLMLLVCQRNSRMDLAELLSLYMIVTVLFIGFFTQIEGTVSAALFCLELALCLLHKDERKVSSVLGALLLIICSILTLHFNEFFVAWSIILAIAVLFRVWKEKELSKLWTLVGLFHIYVAVQSKLDMADRGIENQPKLTETLGQILQNKSYFTYIGLLILIGFFAYNFVEFKGKVVVIIFLEIILTLILGLRIYRDSTSIALCAYQMRFVTFGWGICIGVFLLAVEIVKKKYLRIDLIWLCIILCLLTAFFNRRTGHELRDFHLWEVGYCYNHPNEGYIPITETGFQGSAYNGDWIGTLGCFDAELLHGITHVTSIVDLSWSDDYGRLTRGNDAGYDKYGVTIDYDVFEANPQVDFEIE